MSTQTPGAWLALGALFVCEYLLQCRTANAYYKIAPEVNFCAKITAPGFYMWRGVTRVMVIDFLFKDDSVNK